MEKNKKNRTKISLDISEEDKRSIEIIAAKRTIIGKPTRPSDLIRCYIKQGLKKDR